jgi:gliding motility-associated-like protein
LLSDSLIKNPIATPVVSTTYTVTLTGFSGCKNVDSITVYVADYPVVNAGPDFTICNNVNGKMAATASDTSGPLVYSWSPWLTPGGLVPPVPASSIPPGTCKLYAFSATNQYGCKSWDTVQVCRSVVTVSLGPDVTLCRGDGYTMNPTSGNLLQTYSWTPTAGLSSSTIANPVASPSFTVTYTLNVTDTAGCPASDDIKVTVLPVPIVDAGPTDSVCTGKGIKLFATGSAGVTWSWDNSDGDVTPMNVNNPTVTPAQSKYYYVTVTAVNGCTATDSIWIEVLPLPNVQTSADFSICASDSIQLSTSGAYAYTWIPIGQPGFGCNFCPDPIFYAYAPGVPPGSTSYVVQGVDIYGCAARDTVTITINPLPPVSAGPDVFICIDDTTTLTATGAGIGGSYTWTASPNLSCTSCASPQAYPPVTETFIVMGTDANGCRSIDKVKVNVFTSSSIFVTADPTICYGESIPLTAFHPNAQNYTWSPDSSLSSPTGGTVVASPTVTTVYTVIVTDNNNCFQQTTVTVTVNPLPNVITIPPDVTICFGDSAQLDAGGAISYIWGPTTWISNANIRNPKASPPVTTVYTVTGTDVNGCKNTAPLTVNVNQLPPVDAGVDQAICIGDTTQLQATGAGLGGTYFWTPAVGMISAQSDPDPFVNPTVTQIYLVEGTDANGCKNTDAVTVNINPLPPVSAGPDIAICIGDNTPITASGAGATGTYTWSPPTGLSGTSGATVTATPPAVGSYTYTVLGTDNNGCENTDDMVLTANALPVVNAGSDVTICFDDLTLMNATGALTYSWSPTIGLSNPIIASPYASPPTTTTYVVTGINGNGCEDYDTVTVFVNPLPNVDAGTDVAICFGDTTLLQATGAGAAGTYLWSPTSSLTCASCDATDAYPAATQVYVVTGTDVNGCKNTSSVTVTVNPLPPVNAGPDFTIYKGVCIAMPGTGALTYVWTPSTYLSDPNIPTPMLCPTSIDTVTYYLLGTDQNGCQNLDSVTVRVIGVPDVSLPTAFTPNGDGINDDFRIIKTHNFILTRLQVFNRWGQIVFETTDITAGWDGTALGSEQPIGAYVYVVHGTDEMGIPVLTEGNVTLIR